MSLFVFLSVWKRKSSIPCEAHLKTSSIFDPLAVWHDHSNYCYYMLIKALLGNNYLAMAQNLASQAATNNNNTIFRCKKMSKLV